jgi:hypothetical protein
MATSTTDQKSATAIKLGTVEMPVRISFANIWQPKANKSGKEKFSVSVIIDKDDTRLIKKIQRAIESVKTSDAALKKWGGKVPKNVKTPLRDGDEDREEDGAYEGCMFVNATSDTAPGIFEKIKNKILKVTDKAKVYSGCYCIVSVNFFAFFAEGNKGIACGLNNILKVKDGEALAGKVSGEVDFKEFGEFEEAEEFEEDNYEEEEDENTEDW